MTKFLKHLYFSVSNPFNRTQRDKQRFKFKLLHCHGKFVIKIKIQTSTELTNTFLYVSITRKDIYIYYLAVLI